MNAGKETPIHIGTFKYLQVWRYLRPGVSQPAKAAPLAISRLEIIPDG